MAQGNFGQLMIFSRPVADVIAESPISSIGGSTPARGFSAETLRHDPVAPRSRPQRIGKPLRADLSPYGDRLSGAGLGPASRSLALNLLRRLADQGRAVLVISHDLSAVLPVADQVTVLHKGRTIEAAPSSFIRASGPRHPYSKALSAALPENGFNATPLALENPAQQEMGCGFLDACGSAIAQCHQAPPPWEPGPGAKVQCHCG